MFCCNIIDNNETVSSNTACCGTINYDPDLYMCCSEVINSKGSKTACCGIKSYDPDMNVCCSGVINYNIGSKTACCGTKCYDPDLSICCGDGEIISKNSIC